MPAAAGMARDRVRGYLEAVGCRHLVEDAVLIVSELVTNAVRESRPDVPIEVRLHFDGGKPMIQVEDSCAEPPRRRSLDGESLSGRGLHIVEALSSRCGYTPTATGKVVWAVLG